MAAVIWNEHYSVNIRIFDEEHKKLIDCLNKLYEAVERGEGSMMVGGTLQEFMDATSAHFVHEEKVLSQYNFPTLKEHTSEHNKLLDDIRSYKVMCDRENAVLTIDSLQALERWLLDHIVKEDKKYTTFLMKKLYFNFFVNLKIKSRGGRLLSSASRLLIFFSVLVDPCFYR